MCHYMDIIKCFKMGALVGKRGVVIKLLWLVVLKICFEKLATMTCLLDMNYLAYTPSTKLHTYVND